MGSEDFVICNSCLKEGSVEQFIVTQEGYKGTCFNCGENELIALDSGFKEIYLILKEKNYDPTYSCSGHDFSSQENQSVQMPYLGIKGKFKRSPKGFEASYNEDHKQTTFYCRIEDHKKALLNILEWAREIKPKDKVKHNFLVDANVLLGKKHTLKYLEHHRVSYTELVGELSVKEIMEKRSKMKTDYLLMNVNCLKSVYDFSTTTFSSYKNILLYIELNQDKEEVPTVFGWGSFKSKKEVTIFNILKNKRSKIKIPYGKFLLNRHQLNKD